MSYRGGQRGSKRTSPPNFTPTFPSADALFGRGSGMFGGRGAVGAPTGQQGPTQDVYLQPGVGYFDRRSGRFIGPENKRATVVTTSTPVVSGLDGAGRVDLRKSDTYKQYAQTPAAQFERYFQTPEMTPYFGGAFQGKGAPTSAQAMIDLASQAAAPTTAPLASYYAAQSATGRGSTDEIISAMGYKGTPMEQWAKANPMLAFREFDKKYPSGALTQGPTPALPGPPMGEGGTAGQQALEAAQYQLFGDEPLAAQAAQQQATATQADMATTAGLNAGDRARNLTRAFRLGLM